MQIYGRIRLMGIGYRPAIFLSVRGVKKPMDTKPISYEELGTDREYSPSITENVKRVLLGFDYLEVEVSVFGKKETIELEDLQLIEKFKNSGKREFLREMNEMAFLDLIEKVNSLKEKVLTLSQSENNNLEVNIELLSEKIRSYEKVKSEFVDWFVSNNMVVPSIPQQKYSLKSAQKKIMSGNQNDLNVSISCFDTLVLIVPKHIEPGKKVGFRLEGNSHQTKLFQLDQVPYSYLMYLAMERKDKGKMWMLNPESHVDELHQIYEQLELPVSYAKEIINEIPSRMNWFNDHKNNYRKTINSEINAIVRKEGCIKGSLLYNLGKVSLLRNGIYTLAKSIQNIK